MKRKVIVIPGGDDLGGAAYQSTLSLAIHVAGPPARHCDEYMDDLSTPEVLRKYLAFARAPAHGAFLPKPHPTLFADYEGTRVRITMASVLGDVGITTDFTRDMGYDRRVSVSQLSNLSETP